mmetsp:Transcript_17945/g.25432  ORF Transcript_17945/g.25432 Transcript_17945/m.25432 type:complete len:358 (-) Transcript_17945:98-1171(-)|eukprot:CAMPEP_0201697024 /NCGR_PEP_ID=MMETSP0578-20130828/9265_1 /ASSEMBLY_ACC=CAM_ASM_000663 /TAXON_ID=267565 /ORGANISM="Skeletonema grethea, Strain CCMP 1804" /LENGTH=357 /DNA_ID=CAMNT_0048183081 /DNA_START=33 /DNA_END=1106 /DNA_ORIENTATION=+
MSRRQSFAVQVDAQRRASGVRRSSTIIERISLAEAVGSETDEVTMPFTSKFAPPEMRQLALVAHNHMKPAMKQFIETYSEILKKFRITGTQTTMKMCKSMWGEDDPAIHYGLTCTSGPLGGDAQIAALMCMEDLGGMIFFIDPLSAHPHQADIDSLQRLANCGNIIVCCNPASASSMMYTLKSALMKGSKGMIPSFFETLESPAVEEYKHQQAVALANVIKGNSPSAPPAPVAPPQAAEPPSKAVSFGTEKSVSFGENTMEVEEKKVKTEDISQSTIDKALMGQSMMLSNVRLQALLAVDSDHDSDDDDDDDEDSSADAPKSKSNAKVSMGLFGIKTKKNRMGLKKLGKSVRKMMSK